jgi:hypothetical protein
MEGCNVPDIMEHRMWVPSLLSKSPPSTLYTENALNAIYRVYMFDVFPARLMEEITARFIAVHFVTESRRTQQIRQYDAENPTLSRKATLLRTSMYISTNPHKHTLNTLNTINTIDTLNTLNTHTHSLSFSLTYTLIFSL